MSQRVSVVSVVVLLLVSPHAAVADPSRSFNARDFGTYGDGETDETAAFTKCFATVAKAGGGTVTIAPGDYYLPGNQPIELSSRTTVFAYGARFHLPKVLGDKARIVLFSGTDLDDFSWFGGHFRGRCFDHRRESNTWEPNTNTRMIEIKTTQGGATERLIFRDIKSHRVAGAVIGVSGVPKAGSQSEVDTFAKHITIENCTLLESGKFMWDYGLLWQILVWPEDYAREDVAMAGKYFRNDLIVDDLKMADNEDRIWLDNSTVKFTVSQTVKPDQGICFFCDVLPKNIQRGRIYYITEVTDEFVKVSEQLGGKPIQFQGTAGPSVKLIRNLHAAFLGLYKPIGAGPGKGGLDLVCCQHVTVRGCQLSSLGDTMHIQKCHGVVFTGNQITGSRMGAFFLAEYCKNATITGNTIDGGNGSRVMSVEKSCEDVTIIGNTFRNGGRGSWINQPKNLILQGNIFINNTTKGEHNPWRGRRSWKTGDWEQYPEMYFTLHQPDGKYGPVIIRDNIFQTGSVAVAAIHFERGGADILVDGNIFRGSTGKILVDQSTKVTFGTNINAQIERPAPSVRFGNP